MPVVDQVSAIGSFPQFAFSRYWTPSEPVVAWLVLRPRLTMGPRRDTTVKRLTAWSYRAGYGGFIMFALYPYQCRTDLELAAWRQDIPAGTRLMDWAADASTIARAHRCRVLIAATGILDRAGQEHLRIWLDIFWHRGGISPRRWLCLGTEDGWPMAPTVHGRRPPGDDATLVSWKLPKA